MSRRGENIRKRKDGRWEGRFKDGYKINGSTKYSSVYGKTYHEVKLKLEEKKRQNNLEKIILNEDYSFKEILSLWFETNRIKFKGSTEIKYQHIIEKHILPELGNIQVADLNSTSINLFLEHKLKAGRLNGRGGLSASYVKFISIIISSAIKYAISEGLCRPFKICIYKPEIIKKELTILSRTSQQNFENVILSNLNETTIGIYIALHTGLRIGEICALSWHDIDFKNKTLHVRHTVSRVSCNNEKEQKTKLIIDTPKTKSSFRDVPISSKLFPVLKQAYENACSEFVISNSEHFVSTRTFDYRYRSFLKKHNIELINFHALRHTFATRCIEAGVDIKSLSEMLGHTNTNITLNTYVHSSLELKRSQLEKLYQNTI